MGFLQERFGWGEKQRPMGSVPALICLSGLYRGKVFRLEEGHTYHLVEDRQGGASITDAVDESTDARVLAHFHSAQGAFALQTTRETKIRLNGALVLNAVLGGGDMLELERPPCLFRYGRTCAEGEEYLKPGALLSDCLKRTRFESANWLGFAARLPVNMVSDIRYRSGLHFRLFMVAVLGLLAALSVMQWQRAQDFDHLAEELAELSSATDWVRHQQAEFISREELDNLGHALGSDLSEARRRVLALESRPEAAKRILSGASRAIVFLQGAWVYQEPDGGRKLRYVVTEQGGPIVTMDGNPMVTFDGEGPIVSNQFSGTAFVVSPDGRLMTNRHVAQPWENDPALEIMRQSGIQPVFERFIGYLPGMTQPFEVVLEALSDTADLAILTCSDIRGQVVHIPLSKQSPTPGDEVYVLGYPTGLRALVARSSPGFIDRIEREKLDFWSIAGALAENSLMQPLVSRGIVGQVSMDAVAYDADTARGGSGGPVLNSKGELVAVNAAILPEYGGSNLGVPLARVNQLMAQLTVE